MINIDPKLQSFFQMVKKLKNKKSELTWRKDKFIHRKDEDNSEIIEQLNDEINQLMHNYIPEHINRNSNDFKTFFSDAFIEEYIKNFHKDYVRPSYGLQGIQEENEYDSYQYWKECAAYYEKQRNGYFMNAVEFCKNLEAMYEWKHYDLSN